MNVLRHLLSKTVEWEVVEAGTLKRIRKVKPLRDDSKRLRYLSKEDFMIIYRTRPERYLAAGLLIVISLGVSSYFSDSYEEYYALGMDRKTFDAWRNLARFKKSRGAEVVLNLLISVTTFKALGQPGAIDTYCALSTSVLRRFPNPGFNSNSFGISSRASFFLLELYIKFHVK